MTKAIGMKETVLFAGGGLSVALSHACDRYCHTVLAGAGDNTGAGDNMRAILGSLEGADQEAWPSSPPFQEVHIERPRNGIETALVVGRAGRSHWSASIEADRSQEAITFDIACRSSGAIEWLGSRYRCLVEVGALPDGARTLVLTPEYELEVLEGDLQLTEMVATRALTITPRFRSSPTAQTVRWKYRIARRSR